MFNIHIELEKWKLNKEYNLYVSTLGRVKDIKKKIIEPVINSCGYFVVKVDNKVIAVHSLVMLTFKGQRQEGMTIDHLNSNRRDNRLKNLEYVTQEENLNRANNKLLKSLQIRIALLLKTLHHGLENIFKPMTMVVLQISRHFVTRLKCLQR